MSSEDKPEKPPTRRQQGLPPFTDAEKKRRSVAKKKQTHFQLGVFIDNKYKDDFDRMCRENGLKQSEMIETLIVNWLSQEQSTDGE